VGNTIDDIKLIDFGCATHMRINDAREITGYAGTPMYMAPELLEDKFYNSKVDCYSLGIVLFELLSK